MSEKRFGERGALIRNIGFVADQRHRAFWIILAQRVAGAGAADATANNQIITLDHAPAHYRDALSVSRRKFVRSPTFEEVGPTSEADHSLKSIAKLSFQLLTDALERVCADIFNVT